MIPITFDRIESYANYPLNITLQNGKDYLAFFQEIREGIANFYVLKDDTLQTYSLKPEDFLELDISLSKTYRLLEGYPTEDILDLDFFKNKMYNIKVLGYCEIESEDTDCIFKKQIILQCHDKYLQITLITPDFTNMLYASFPDNCIEFKEIDSINDLEFNKNGSFFIYKNIKDAKSVVVQELTGDIITENDDIKLTADDYDIKELADGEAMGVSFGAFDLITESDIFDSSIYFNFNSFYSVNYEKFMKECFNIDIKEIQRQDMER